MFHENRKMLLMMVGIAALALFLGLGITPLLLILLVCPLMMFFMMRSMAGSRDSTDQGNKHDHPAEPRS